MPEIKRTKRRTGTTMLYKKKKIAVRNYEWAGVK
jgi:hypothetical protein